MDYYHLRAGWRNQQHESDHHYPSSSSSTKIPRLFLLEQPPLHQEASDSSSALPLFVPEPIINNKTTNLSVLSDSTTSHSRGNMIGLFSLAQWQELELQALIFKYMLAGAPVPSQLLQHIKKNLFNTSPPPPYYQLYNHPLQHYHHYQPAMLQSGYWGRTAVDPEPGRCRRTDGKKWRCSRDVVTGQKYCERHMHRGRNRSRKPVEIPSRPSPTTVTIASAGSGGDVALNSTTTTTSRPPLVASLPNTAMNIGNQHYVLDGPSSSPSMNLLQLNQRYQEKETRNNHDHSLNESRSDNQVLRHFFDDWPKSGTSTNNVNEPVSSTSLSISIEGGAGSDHHQTFPDFSLKLTQEDTEGGERAQLNWPGMSSRRGGPLAEALQSSTSNSSSPTSTLPPLHGFGSESSSVLTK